MGKYVEKYTCYKTHNVATLITLEYIRDERKHLKNMLADGTLRIRKESKTLVSLYLYGDYLGTLYLEDCETFRSVLHIIYRTSVTQERRK